MSEPLNFGRPWLEEPAWEARRIVYRYGGRIHGCFWALAVLGFTFVGPPLALIVGSRFGPSDAGPAFFLAGGSLAAAAAVFIWWGVRTVAANPQGAVGLNSGTIPTHAFEMVCHLRTFPGVIGGWFKAEIETALPDTPTEIHLTLACLRQSGKYPHVVWKARAELPPAAARARDGVYRIPAAFQIPELAEYTASTSRWLLSVVVVSVKGVAYSGTFTVPVFATHLAPASEQRAPSRQEET